LLLWIWELAGARDILRWLGNYFNFSHALLSALVGSWFRAFSAHTALAEPWYPALWLWLTQNYALPLEWDVHKRAISYQPREPEA